MPRRQLPKSAPARRKRGSSGLSKPDRITKQNALVDYYAAKKHLADLNEVSSSSSGDDAGRDAADASSDDAAPDDLHKLRALLGCNSAGGDGGGGRAGAQSVGVSALARRAARDGGDAEMTLEDVVLGSAADDDDEDDEEEADGEDMRAEALGFADEAGADGDFFGSEWDEELDAFQDEELAEGEEEDDEDAADLERMATGGQLALEDDLPKAAFVSGDGEERGAGVVDRHDPFVAKYIFNTCGKPDDSELQPVPERSAAAYSAALSGPSSNGAGVDVEFTVAASQRAREHLRLVETQSTQGKSGAFVDALCFESQPHTRAAARAADASAATAATDAMFRLCSSYADVLLTCRTWTNAEAVCRAYACHAVNHVLKAQTVTAANDALLSQGPADSSDAANVRDRGFGKTRVLVLLPMRNAAYRFVQHVCQLLRVDWDTFCKTSTFASDFSEMDEVKDPTFHRRPPDFQRQFDGNINDTFCFGVNIHKAAARSCDNAPRSNSSSGRVVVYVPFLECEMVVASPLGLRKRLEKDGNLSVSLSSIEVCVVDEAHVMLMQSWAHVDAIFAQLNRRPTTTTEGLNDVMRVYSWALAGQSRRHRQTILVSAFSNAAFARTLRESCCNNSGRVVVGRTYAGAASGSIGATPAALRQHFVRLRVDDLAGADDARFAYFTGTWFPTKIQPLLDQSVRVILYIPNYFDFARLRRWLGEQHRATFAVICEHSTQKEQRQALGQFTDQERCLLVMTERFYFFRRYFVRSAEAVFFYSPPLVASFYSDIVARLNTASPQAQAHLLFCRYDVHELTRIVGADRARQMLLRPADAFMLVNNA